jgi:hypothetical protein
MRRKPTDGCTPPPAFPRCVSNRPGLSRIDYRIGTYADIRNALLYQLNRCEILSDWTHRGADDPGIALLEGAAILGDILTFYQELYANEAYLKTAKWRESVADLVKLVGYRLTPGVGGHGVFAFQVRGDRAVTVPIGFPFTAQVTGVDGTIDFQTEAELAAYPWLGRFNLLRPSSSQPISSARREITITASKGELLLQPGDRLLIGPPKSPGSSTINGAATVIVDKVRDRHGLKLYTLKGGVPFVGQASLIGYKIGRSFRHFGHNSPPTKLKTTGTGTDAVDFWMSERKTTLPSVSDHEFPLDVRVDDLSVGTSVLVQRTPRDAADYAETSADSIESIRQDSLTWGAITGASTVLKLAGILVDRTGLATTTPSGQKGGLIFATFAVATGTALFAQPARVPVLGYALPSPDEGPDIRDLQLHEVRSPQLVIQACPEDDPKGEVKGTSLDFFGTAEEAKTLTKRELLCVVSDGNPATLKIKEVGAPPPGSSAEQRLLRPLILDSAVEYKNFPLEDSQTVVYGNLVKAKQGKSERETVLGDGDSRQVFQTFKLPKAPLTYFTTAGAAPPEVPELELRVSRRLWQRVSTLFGCKSDDEVYIVREDNEGNSWVQFGDGKTGARLPSGAANVSATWRTGIGAFGELKPDTRVQPSGRLDGLDSIVLTGDGVSGGDQPESGDRARVCAPGKVQALGRLVSLADFETEARLNAGVARAGAAWRLEDGVPTIVLSVLMDTARGDADFTHLQELIAEADRRRGMTRSPIVVNRGHRDYFWLEAQIEHDPRLLAEDVRRSVEAVLQVEGALDPAADGTAGRCFGQQLWASELEGFMQNAQGVRWVRITGLGPGEADAGDHLVHSPLTPAKDGILALKAGQLKLTLTPVAMVEALA